MNEICDFSDNCGDGTDEENCGEFTMTNFEVRDNDDDDDDDEDGLSQTVWQWQTLRKAFIIGHLTIFRLLEILNDNSWQAFIFALYDLIIKAVDQLNTD